MFPWVNPSPQRKRHLDRCGGRPQPRRHCVRWGPSSPPLKGHHPNFRPMSFVAKRVGGLRCHLVRQFAWPRRLCVRLGPSSPRKRAQPHPILGPCLLWPNGWMDEDATWYGSRPRTRPHCVRWGPSSRRERGHSSPRLFSAHIYCGNGRPSQLLLISGII